MKLPLSLFLVSWVLNAGQISVRLYDLSDIARSRLDLAEHVASGVYAQTGVELDWEQGNPNSPEAHETDQSALSAVRAHSIRPYLVVQIRGDIPDRIPLRALGASYPYGQFGVSVILFKGRIGNASEESGVDFGVLLGYAIAHELGHVILGLEDHTRAGIMRAHWGFVEFREIQMGAFGFSSAQAQRIRLFARRQEQTRSRSTELATAGASNFLPAGLK